MEQKLVGPTITSSFGTISKWLSATASVICFVKQSNIPSLISLFLNRIEFILTACICAFLGWKVINGSLFNG